MFSLAKENSLKQDDPELVNIADADLSVGDLLVSEGKIWEVVRLNEDAKQTLHSSSREEIADRGFRSRRWHVTNTNQPELANVANYCVEYVEVTQRVHFLKR
jgi:hypothetical protein